MKKIIPLIAVFFAMANLHAQSIPNAGFEQWNNGEASSWATSFSYSGMLLNFEYQAGERATDAHDGSYAMKVHPYDLDLTIASYTLPGLCHLGYFNTEADIMSILGNLTDISAIIDAMVYGGISCNRVPEKVTAWIKYIPSGDDAMSVTVQCLRDDNVVAEGTYSRATATSGYVQIEIPVTATMNDDPTTLNVIFNCGKTTGSELYIDDVDLVLNNIGIDEPCNAIFTLGPNPANDVLNITPTLGGSYDYRLYDANGKTVAEQDGVEGTATVNVAGLSQGVYFLKVSNNGLSRTEKVVIR
ncbi:MAG: T9SS type A sorting domain-containing protein [Bacteroidales bacterium]|nr:T9SS type A sorting domain-containing protein [Bacteroidales bacterium]